MRRIIIAAAGLSAALVLSATPAAAGVYSDDLAKCLVKATSEADQTDLVLWVFSAMASHPAVKPYANFSKAQHDAIDIKGAALFERLITGDCRHESVAALKYEGAASFESSFETLGQVAMRGLITNPDVASALTGMSSHVDAKKIQELNAEAGVSAGSTDAPKP